MNDGNTVRQWRQRFNGARLPESQRKTPYIIGDIEPYISPMTNELITSRSKHREDLERHGCRVYEGREQEVKCAEQAKAEQDRKFEETISNGVEETYYQLRDGLIKPETSVKSQWAIGED